MTTLAGTAAAAAVLLHPSAASTLLDGELQIETNALFSGLRLIMMVVADLESNPNTAPYGQSLRDACDLITDGVMNEVSTKERELEELRESMRRTHREPGTRRTAEEQ